MTAVTDRLLLHRARVQKGIDLPRIVALTALHPAVVARIDGGQFEDLPPGIYARAAVRAFAGAVGLNPHHVMGDVEPFLPPMPDPLPGLREHAPPSPFDSLRSFFATQRVLPESWAGAAAGLRRVAASTIDALLLLMIGGAMLGLASWVCGVGLDVLLREAGAELALTFSVPVCLYFILLEQIGGRTVGGMLCGAESKTGSVILRVSVPMMTRPRSLPRQWRLAGESVTSAAGRSAR